MEIQYDRSRMLRHLAEKGVDLSPHTDNCTITISGNCDCPVTAEERDLRDRRGVRKWELMKRHTKAELLRLAFAGGLVNYNQPAKWRKDEIAAVVADQQLPN